MKYLQLFESTRHPWTGEVRQFYILWDEGGAIIDHGVGHPALECDEKVVKLRPVLRVKIKDFNRTVESANSLVVS